MPAPRRSLHLVIQRVGDDRGPSFRVIAYGEAGRGLHAEFSSLRALQDALAAAVPGVVLGLCAEGSIIFTGEMELDEVQLRTLGLA